jgi:hypothetical protein
MNREVYWDYDRGICGVWQANVAGTLPGQLGVDLFAVAKTTRSSTVSPLRAPLT